MVPIKVENKLIFFYNFLTKSNSFKHKSSISVTVVIAVGSAQ